MDGWIESDCCHCSLQVTVGYQRWERTFALTLSEKAYCKGCSRQAVALRYKEVSGEKDWSTHSTGIDIYVFR